MTLDEAHTNLIDALKGVLEQHDLNEDDRYEIEDYLYSEFENAAYGHGIPSAFDHERLSADVRDEIAPLNEALSREVEAYLMAA